MIEISNQYVDPTKTSLDEIKSIINQMHQHKEASIKVIWDDSTYSQEDLLKSYLPITKYAQSLGLNVECIMSVNEAKRLVRYPKMMFVDPLFLFKFRFKSIRFDLHDIKELNT